MLVARLCQVSLTPIRKSVTLKTLLIKPSGTRQIFRTFGDENRNTFQERLSKRRSLKDAAMAPAGDTAFNIGRGAMAGGAAFGLGALCYYGLGLSKHSGVADHYVFWPEYVKERVRTTYMYFGSSLALTAATAAVALRSPVIINLMTKNSFLAIMGTMAAMIGSGVLAQSLPYKPGFGAKQLAWMLHTSILGTVVAPICLLGGSIVTRAAWYTLGIVGGLSTIAVCAPSERFLTMAGPLAVGLGVVLAASIGSAFLPPTTALGAGLFSISLYGGLLLFSGLLLYDTQRIIRNAETHPEFAPHPYDPINASISIYLDTINIFMRMAIILAGGGNRRK